jgi:arginyl-tRNA synthetase
LERTAEAYHDVHERCPAEEPARVALAEAVEITLRNGLLMLGENPRERL